MATGGLTLADLTGIEIWHLRGDNAALRAAYGRLPGEIGGVLSDRRGLIARLTDDECLWIASDRAGVDRDAAPDPDRSAEPPAQGQTPPSSASSSDPLVTVTEVSHGYGLMQLAGAEAPAALSKLCGLDFAGDAFPDLYAAQTSLAKVRALVLRHDQAGQSAYLIAVGRSLAEYVWAQLLDAGAEFGVAVAATGSSEGGARAHLEAEHG